MATINFGSWNIGCGYDDYKKMLTAIGKEEPAKRREIWEKHRSKINVVLSIDEFLSQVTAPAQREFHDPIEQAVAEQMAKTFDVICLQNMGSLERTAIKALSNEFTIISVGSNGDTAIALRTTMFEDTQNLSKASSTQVYKSKSGNDIAAVTTVHKITKMRLCFASVHPFDFHLFAPDVAEQYRKYNDAGEKYVENANLYMRQAVEIATGVPVDGVVLAGSMHDTHNDKTGPRTFELLRQKGFQVLSPNTPTHVVVDQYKERVVDHIFVKTPKIPLWKRILMFVCFLFVSRRSISSGPCTTYFSFNESYSSAHLPVGTRIKLTNTPSLFSKFCPCFNKTRK